ncbi:MAG: SusF/SusE family outer membrane protein [Muribaculaceae bacterium]|nr:SusF/SusE family outer membrane protein [Muribaculaceae bacterium]
MKILNLIAAATLLLAANSATASTLYIVGDALPIAEGWSIDATTSLLSVADNDGIYSATLYLKANSNFKFLAEPNYDATQYAPATGAQLTDGTIAIQAGQYLDTNFQVPESANYNITVNTTTLEASFTKASYQSSELTVASLYIVGDITPEAWIKDEYQMPMRQDPEAPEILTTGPVECKAGNFKIATNLWGVRDWNQAYFLFRDAADETKYAQNQDGDLQWNIAEAGKYNISLNTATKGIAIKRVTASGITDVEDCATEAVYYNLQGTRVGTPEKGCIYIRVRGTTADKVVF